MKMDKNFRLLLLLAIPVGLMIGIVSQAEPIYRMFCGATGLNGTTQNAAAAPQAVEDRTVTVNFDSNVDPALPWDFAPDVRSVQVKLGQTVTIKYHAHNRSDRAVVGTAVHNVQPDKAGLYFDKLQCFCFTKQVLNPGQTAELPVQFFVDPDMTKDRNADDITNITLSYTFYLAKDQSKAKTVKQTNAAPTSTPDTP